MTNLVSWLNSSALPATTVPVALVCAVVGAIVLSLYTRWMGMATLLINGLALFGGAYLANLLAGGLKLPLDRYYEQPIVLSFVGMSVIAILVLRVFSKNRDLS